MMSFAARHRALPVEREGRIDRRLAGRLVLHRLLAARAVDQRMDGARVGGALGAQHLRGLAGEGGELNLPVDMLGEIARKRRLARAGIAEQAENLGTAGLQPSRHRLQRVVLLRREFHGPDWQDSGFRGKDANAALRALPSIEQTVNTISGLCESKRFTRQQPPPPPCGSIGPSGNNSMRKNHSLSLTPELVALCASATSRIQGPTRVSSSSPTRRCPQRRPSSTANAARTRSGCSPMGQLIWKPEVEAVETRRATAHGWHRSFSMELPRWRGSPEQPGQMMVIERGGTCHGVAFRLAGRGPAGAPFPHALPRGGVPGRPRQRALAERREPARAVSGRWPSGPRPPRLPLPEAAAGRDREAA